MTNLRVIEHQGQRVLTTSQLAEAYETETIKINQNFSRNKLRYKEGKHYFILKGADLKQFKNEFDLNEVVGTRASSLYLWTEKGAFMHAKSIETDRAWEAYEMLVDEYYCLKEKASSKIRVEDVLSMTVDRLILNEKTVSHALSIATETRTELEQLKEEFQLFKKSRWNSGTPKFISDSEYFADQELREALSKKIYLFSQKSGIPVKKVWCVDFDREFYRQYKINPSEGKEFGLTRPKYLSSIGYLSVAIEVVDEMIAALGMSEPQAA
ncbi:hypothetical protein GJ688_12680 [Heliobacillus mobilis]|uniref:KilA-N DNA-binding domain-containing protein n=1 Tax=Heliobacterium mobile TaxID=28064 RepID=A0A6I3SNJ3_HELMO|nr:ORF6N domain-containing protein [Heliobacterium mobile]MTV49827.1 hypothetical protein [Heliobacterium mobile]